MQRKNQFYKTVSYALNSITHDQETILHDHNDTDVKHKKGEIVPANQLRIDLQTMT